MFNFSTLKTQLGLVCICLLASTAVGCIYEVGIPADGDKTYGELNPIRGMAEQPKFRDQEAQPMYRDDQAPGMRYPAAQTIPVAARDNLHVVDPDISAQMANPVALTEENLQYGKFAYETSCAVCHGQDGSGNGYIIPKFPQPPSLLSNRTRNMADGQIFHVITYGQGMMWSYKSQLEEMERWAVVNYIRALQRADFPEPADLDRGGE